MDNNNDNRDVNENIEDEKYTFVNETIKKKPPFIIRAGFKILYILGMGAVFGLGICLVLYALDRNVKDIFFGEKDETVETTSKIEVEIESETLEGETVADLESLIDKKIVEIYAITYQKEEESTTDEVESVGISDSLGNNATILSPETSSTETESTTVAATGDSTEETEEEKENARIISKTSKTGVLIAINYHLYILTQYEDFKNCDEIKVEFYNGDLATATVHKADEVNGIAIIEVKKDQVINQVYGTIRKASIVRLDELKNGDTIIYAGNPYDEKRLFYTGTLAGVDNGNINYDTFYRGIITDITVKNVDDGFLFNKSGQLVGMVMDLWKGKSGENTITAMGVEDVYSIIDNLVNKLTINHIGIKGEKVTDDIKNLINEEMPNGLYITDVQRGSSAYSAGIMVGDIVTEMNGKTVESLHDVQKILADLKNSDIVTMVLKRKIGVSYSELRIKVSVESY